MEYIKYRWEKMFVKTIVCFGDSNTWGANPAGGPRFSMDERWPGILRKELGEGYWVAEEGLNGRTTVWDDPIEGPKNGKQHLIPCIESQMPADLVIIMLGTNDLKKRFSVSARDIADGAGVLVGMVQNSIAGPDWKAPKVLLIAPPPIIEVGPFSEVFEGGAEKSLKFSQYYKNVAERNNCAYLDSSAVVKSSKLDGIHLEASEHLKLGKAVAEKVKEILG
jgi:lysophospholipase L1-like esterase